MALHAVLTQNTSDTIWKNAMLIIEITQDDPDPAATSAPRNDLSRCLISCGIPQELVLTALQKLLTLKILRFCKPSSYDEWEIQE